MGPAALIVLAALAPGCMERAPAPGSPGQAAADPSPQQVTVTHVGNAGFLIRSGDDAILVDALYREGVEGYEVIPAAQRALLEAAQPPFDGVDLILVTHAHADHFDPEAVGLHMSANPTARLITTPEGEQRLSEAFPGFGALDDRVSGVLLPEGTAHAVPGAPQAPGIEVQVLGLAHGATPHIGFLVTIGGVRLLHVGDTDAVAGDYAPFDLARQGIDVALVPYWLLAYEAWRGSVPPAIGARRLLAMHLPLAGGPAEDADSTGGRAAMLADMAVRFPGVIILDESMASVTLSGLP